MSIIKTAPTKKLKYKLKVTKKKLKVRRFRPVDSRLHWAHYCCIMIYGSYSAFVCNGRNESFGTIHENDINEIPLQYALKLCRLGKWEEVYHESELINRS